MGVRVCGPVVTLTSDRQTETKVVEKTKIKEVPVVNTEALYAVKNELETLNKLKEKDIETKDRVDISLVEYNRLKHCEESLNNMVTIYKAVYKQLHDELRLSPEECYEAVFKNIESKDIKIMINFDPTILKQDIYIKIPSKFSSKHVNIINK